MQERINKILFFIIPILIVFFIVINVLTPKKEEEYTFNMFYMDTYIYLKIYTNSVEQAEQIKKGVDEIYKKYDILANKYKEYENIHNLYYINYNTSNEENITIDKELYELIKYGIDAYKKTNGLVDISLGNVLDIWKSYINSKYGLPTKEELERANTSNISDIILLDNYQIKNNHPNIDLGAITKGYVSNLVSIYLKENNINKYIINAGGNVIVGDNFNNNKYAIGIEDPDDRNDVIKVIYANNTSVVTSGGYERFYEWEGNRYNHIINPKTLYPVNNMKSVTIISKDSALNDILSTMLFIMNIDEGKEYIESLDNVEAIWYTNDNEIITSSGVNIYEQK